MLSTLALAATLAVVAPSRYAVELQDRLIHSMTADGAFALQEHRYDAVVEAISAAEKQDSAERLGVALVLWKDGGVRDPEVIISAINQTSTSPEQSRLIALANHLYRLRQVANEETSDWAARGATPWTRVRRDNYFKWAEKEYAKLKGTCPALEKQLEELFAQHRCEQ